MDFEDLLSWFPAESGNPLKIHDLWKTHRHARSELGVIGIQIQIILEAKSVIIEAWIHTAPRSLCEP